MHEKNWPGLKLPEFCSKQTVGSEATYYFNFIRSALQLRAAGSGITLYLNAAATLLPKCRSINTRDSF